jgi:hypothetical protein
MYQLLSPKKLRHNWKFGADAPWKFNERYRAEAGKLSRRPATRAIGFWKCENVKV